MKTLFKDLKYFLILWSTQSLSSLGSAMTNFALIIWSYQAEGSALTTALLSVCSYAPYVIMSIFAGSLSDKWNKKVTMLVCDTFAAACTVGVLVLLHTGSLQIWHLYALNALNGLMNTIQRPASDVTTTLLVPREHYQKVSGLKSFSSSLINILTPMIATSMYTLLGLHAVIWFDLATFVLAFVVLLVWVKIPMIESQKKDGVIRSALGGLQYLKEHRGILDLILFLAAINFTASVYNAAFPAMILSVPGGGEVALGVMNTITGLTMLAGSAAVSLAPAPKSRVRVICNALMLSMSTENFFLALGNSIPIWGIGSFLGWIAIPIMNANMDVLFREYIPVQMQGRVYSARNTLQFFTIPIGYFVGGWLIDQVFEPWLASLGDQSWLCAVFGSTKGSGASVLFFILGIVGVITCIVFRRDKHIWNLEKAAH
ncbi:MAG: MFS transporter [Firmicutes bacterium]|nr:MFS transporter [Bacillota bacterium]